MRSLCEIDLETVEAASSASLEGDHTPTPSPGIPIPFDEYESTLQELIDAQKWSAAIIYVRQYKRVSQKITSNSNINSIFNYNNSIETLFKLDEVSVILNTYAQNLIKHRQGKCR